MSRIQKVVRARSTRIALGISLLGLGAMGFAPYVFNDVSTQAAVNAPLIRLTAAADGTVSRLPQAGHYFARPTDIRLLDLSQDTGEVADLRAQAELAQAQIVLARQQLAELAAQDARLNRRAAVFTSATADQLAAESDAAQAALRGCEADRRERLATLDRARRLREQGFMSAAGLEKAEAAADLKASDCSSAAARIRSISVTRHAASAGVFIGDSYNDAPYAVQQSDRLLLQRQSVEKTLSDATAQYAQAQLRLKDALARASYRAPAGTLVWTTNSSSGAAIRSGVPVLDLVDCRRRFVQVALAERKAEVIGPGTTAHVRLIGSDHWMVGRVVNITGAAGRRREELFAATTYSLPDSREIMVDVALPTPQPSEFDASRKCDVGRLAEVRFSRSL